jgi:hypothetical protein
VVHILFARDLLFIDPDDNKPLEEVCRFYKNDVNFVYQAGVALLLLRSRRRAGFLFCYFTQSREFLLCCDTVDGGILAKKNLKHF